MIKKKNLMQSLALSALMTSINAIIIFISTISGAFFISDLFLFLFLPLITSFTFLFLDKKMAICYLVASLVICSLINIEKSIFYLIPSLISGFAFALFIERKINIVWIIAICSIINSILSFGLFYLVDIIFDVSIYDAFKALFGVSEEVASSTFPLFIVITSSIQTILNAMIIVPELKKFDVFIRIDDSPNKYILYSSITFAFLCGIGMYFVPAISYYCLGISLLCSIPTYIYIFKQKRYILLGFIVLFLIFGFALYSTFLPGYGILPLSYFVLIISSIGIYLFYYGHRFN